MTETMTGGRAFARQLAREGVPPRVRPARRPDHARARRPLRRAVDPVRDHPARAGHHLPRRRVRPRRRPPRRGVRRARRGGVQRRARGWRPRSRRRRRSCSIAGQINRDGIGKGLGLLHEIDDQLDLVRPITAWQRRALYRRRDPRRRARSLRARAARPPATGRDRDAAGGVLGGAPTSRCSTPADDVRVAADPDQIAAAARVLATAERPLDLGRRRGRARRRDRRAHRPGRVPAGAGRHHPPGQGRDRRPPPARRGIGVGQPPDAARCSTTPT